jgi:hypothetical protein
MAKKKKKDKKLKTLLPQAPKPQFAFPYSLPTLNTQITPVIREQIGAKQFM